MSLNQVEATVEDHWLLHETYSAIRVVAGMFRYAWSTLWWKCVGSVAVCVKWPVGPTSADPHFHYGPWMKATVGKQGRDWQWDIEGNNAAENMLTIRVRKSKAHLATAIGLMWG